MSANRNININLPSNFYNVNRNLNRGNTNTSDNDYDEEVNTTMSKFSNNKSDSLNNFDNISISSKNTNANKNKNARGNSQNKKKETLKSNDNLTQVNKMYATKKPNQKPEELISALAVKKEQGQISNENQHQQFSQDIDNYNSDNDNEIPLNNNNVDPDLEIIEILKERNFEIKKNEALFCVCVDGAQHSEFAFDITIQDLIGSKDKIFVVHIFNSAMDEYFNFRNRKDTIVEKFTTAVLRIDTSRVLFLKEDRSSKIHPLEQVHRIGINHKCNYLVLGYHGMRLQKGDNKELSKGIDYLLGQARIPTIIIKENKLRKNRPNGKLNWLFVFDRAFINCYSVFEKFLPLINKEKDFVYGYTMLPNWVNFDDVNRNFNLDVENHKIRNFDYEVVEYAKNPSDMVKEKVNFGDIQFDFMVFYNNPEKHRLAGKDSDIVNLITKCHANLCFMNGQ